MKLAIDTNRYSDLLRNTPGVLQIIEMADAVYVPLIVLAELRAGFLHGSRRQENESALTLFLNLPAVSVLLPDDQTTFHYADLYAYLRKKGHPVPSNDLWMHRLWSSMVLYYLTVTQTSIAFLSCEEWASSNATTGVRCGTWRGVPYRIRRCHNRTSGEFERRVGSLIQARASASSPPVW